MIHQEVLYRQITCTCLHQIPTEYICTFLLQEIKYFYRILRKSYRFFIHVYHVGKMIRFSELLFYQEILFLKGICKYLTCGMKLTTNKGGYILPRQWSINCYIWIFMKMHLNRVQKCHLDTGIIIMHSITVIVLHHLPIKIIFFKQNKIYFNVTA